MIRLVKNSRLSYFGLYCLVVGISTVLYVTKIPHS